MNFENNKENKEKNLKPHITKDGDMEFDIRELVDKGIVKTQDEYYDVKSGLNRIEDFKDLYD